MELVGDDDERLAVGFHVAHDLEELVGLLRGQNRGRLVEDQNIRTAIEYLDDLDRLLLRDGHVVNFLVGVNVEAVFVADLLDFTGRLGDVHPAMFFQTEDDVFRGGEDIDELEVLVDHADTVSKGVFRRADRNRFTVNVDLPLIGEVDAGEHVHQRCFAAAVFAEQRQDLALVQLQVHGVVGRHLSKPLCNILHPNCAFRSQGGHPFFVGGKSSPDFCKYTCILPYRNAKVNNMTKNFLSSSKNLSCFHNGNRAAFRQPDLDCKKF